MVGLICIVMVSKGMGLQVICVFVCGNRMEVMVALFCIHIVSKGVDYKWPVFIT